MSGILESAKQPNQLKESAKTMNKKLDKFDEIWLNKITVIIWFKKFTHYV